MCKNGCCKTSCCTKTVSKTGPRGPKGATGKTGPTGPMGPGITSFTAVTEVTEGSIVSFNSPAVTEAGDYVVQLEMNVEKVGVSDISFNSFLLKNGVTDTLNANYQHLNRTSGINCTHTHTAKVSLIVGQTAGFQLNMSPSAKVLNGSIVLSKISN